MAKTKHTKHKYYSKEEEEEAMRKMEEEKRKETEEEETEYSQEEARQAESVEPPPKKKKKKDKKSIKSMLTWPERLISCKQKLMRLKSVKDTRARSKICWGCGEIGHFYKDCQNPNK